MYTYHVAGNYDYILQVEVADLPAYEDFHANRLANLPSVAAVTSYVTMKTLVPAGTSSVHSVTGAAHDGDPAGGDESVESRGEEHMRQAEDADAEAAGQPSEGAGDRRGAHEDG